MSGTSFELHHGDCLETMRGMEENSVDSICTDPPYGIRFMGKAWDGKDIEEQAAKRRMAASRDPSATERGSHRSVASEAGKYDRSLSAARSFQEFSEAWATEALRVLKPGAYLLSFASPRTYHRMVSGIEDSGFEIRECVMWLFGSGFPKSHNLHGDREGFGTALKPAYEPIVLARKPLVGTVAENVLEHGTGALNIDGCRVSVDPVADAPQLRHMQRSAREAGDGWGMNSASADAPQVVRPDGRWPANLIHDGSEEVLAGFPQANHKTGGPAQTSIGGNGTYAGGDARTPVGYADTGSAARFFYCAKASRADRNEGLSSGDEPAVRANATMRDRENADWSARNGNHHPTVKPTDLMAYLCRLVTPPGGVVLDPFMGSGSTGKAALREGFRFIGIEREADYISIARARIEHEHERLSKITAANDPQPDLFWEAA